MGTEINENLKIQLETGSTATPFEKYKGKNYKVSLASRNLMFYNTSQFTAEEETWYFLNGQKGAYGSNIGTKTNIKTPVESGETYTISYNVNIEVKSIQIVYSDEIVIETDTGEIGKHNITFTATKNTDIIIRIRPIDNQNVNISNIQIEIGNEATPYVPYMTPIELCKIGNYQDKIYKSNDKWYLEKNINKIQLLSSFDWWLAQTNENTLRFGCRELTNGLVTNNMKIICNRFKNGTGTTDNTDNEHIRNAIEDYPTFLFVNINKTTASDMDEWKEWLNNNETIVYYILNNPVITEITNEILLSQLNELAKAKSFNGQTNITQISEDLPFDLSVDIKTQ